MLQRTSSAQSPSLSQESQFAGGTAQIAGGLDLRVLLQIARRRAPMVVAIAVLAGLAAAIYAMQLTPVYTARATLLIDPPKGEATGAEAVFSRSYVDDSVLESQLELIQTSAMAERVVKRLELHELESWLATNPSL